MNTTTKAHPPVDRPEPSSPPTSTGAPGSSQHGIPLARIVTAELRKSVDTRAGFWLLTSVTILSLLTTGAVLLWASPSELTQATFTTAISVPTSVILPIIAILSITAEWTQRTGLTTFTLIPNRNRVLAAKGVSATIIGVGATIVAFAAGALGNVLGTTVTGRPAVWDQHAADFGLFTLSNVLVMLVGLTIGVIIRNTPGAVVTYFIYAFVAPPLLMLLALNQKWFADAQPWVDPNHAQEALLAGPLTGEQWTQLAATTVLGLLLPAAVGMRNLLRSEVK